MLGSARRGRSLAGGLRRPCPFALAAVASAPPPAVPSAPVGLPLRAPPLPVASGGSAASASLLVRLVLASSRLLVLVRLEQVRGVEEGALLQADVHEGGLNAGQHRFDPAEVDVADRAPVVGAIHQQLDQPVVLQDRHAGFPLAPVDQDLALQACSTSARTEPRPRPGSQSRNAPAKARRSGRADETMTAGAETRRGGCMHGMWARQGDSVHHVRPGSAARSRSAGSRWCPRRSRRPWRRASSARPGTRWCSRSRRRSGPPWWWPAWPARSRRAWPSPPPS